MLHKNIPVQFRPPNQERLLRSASKASRQRGVYPGSYLAFFCGPSATPIYAILRCIPIRDYLQKVLKHNVMLTKCGFIGIIIVLYLSG